MFKDLIPGSGSAKTVASYEVKDLFFFLEVFGVVGCLHVSRPARHVVIREMELRGLRAGREQKMFSSLQKKCLDSGSHCGDQGR